MKIVYQLPPTSAHLHIKTGQNKQNPSVSFTLRAAISQILGYGDEAEE